MALITRDSKNLILHTWTHVIRVNVILESTGKARHGRPDSNLSEFFEIQHVPALTLKPSPTLRGQAYQALEA